MREMEIYKQKKEEEAANLREEKEELMKLQKQEALQLLKRKEKAENIIKVCFVNYITVKLKAFQVKFCQLRIHHYFITNAENKREAPKEEERREGS